MAVSLLSALVEKTSFRRYSLEDVKEILSDSIFNTREGLLTVLENGETLLHLVAGCHDDSVLPMVCQTYQRIGVFSEALLMRNKFLKQPIHIAIECHHFNNTVYLFKESLEVCPKALQPLENGWSLFHSATRNGEGVSIVRYLLSQEVCLPMLVSAHESGQAGLRLPLDNVRDLIRNTEFQLDISRKHTPRGPGYQFMIGPKEKRVKLAKELLLAIEQPTLELKAEESKRNAIEEEKKRYKERQEAYKKEMESLLQQKDIEELVNKYVDEATQETRMIAMSFLAEKCVSHSDFLLPPFTGKISDILMEFLKLPEDNPVVTSCLIVLESYLRSSCTSSLYERKLVGQVLSLTCSAEEPIQRLCCSILSQVSANFSDRITEDDEVIQVLLLIKKFSMFDEPQILAEKALLSLGINSAKDPDPGSWNTHQVAFWMKSHIEIEGISEYRKKFLDAGIDGLHLLELSSAEMMGLGVKFVSHQRKLSALIDDLRRMNKSELGKRDIFLSYAHVDIKFARQIQKVLNSGGYSVWVDETGIRAGQKWRNEIADGIKNCSCLLFIMTQRSANSDYCQDEVGLAEEYHKPILTIKLQQASEIDPGLKLVLYRRQIIDISDGLFTEDNTEILMKGIQATIGQGNENPLNENAESTTSGASGENSDKEEAISLQSAQVNITENQDSLRLIVRDIVREDEIFIKDTVKQVMMMESDRGILRQAVQEVLAVEGGVGGRLRGIIKEVVSEELQQFRTEIMRLVQKQHSSAN